MKDFCVGKENCRRDGMLKAIGSKEIPDRELNNCCDVCTEVPSNLSFELLVGSAGEKRKRRVAVRVVEKELEEELRAGLLKEREKYLELHPPFKMIGADFVCPLAVINDLCSRARFIDCVDDIIEVYDIHKDFRRNLFVVLMDILSKAPATKRRRR